MGDSAYSRWRRNLPARFDQPGGRLLAWLDMMVMDFGFMRPFFNRPQEVVPGIWRSNQPTPARLRKLAGQPGVRTVLNLRGENDHGAWLLERAVCEQHGIKLIDLRLASRKPPKVEQVQQVLAVLRNEPRPILFHCKSGADRAGLVAALAKLTESDADWESVRDQLSFRYLHVRKAETGVLDEFLDAYKEHHEATGDSFEHWLTTAYDRERLKQEFRPSGWANVLVDTLLRRE